MSEFGEDIYNRPQGGAKDGLTFEVPKGAKKLGHAPRIADPRLVGYDRFAARSAPPLQWSVTKDDRMDATVAGQTMKKLYKLYGIQGENPDVLEAFHDAIYFAHTVNGGSVLQPGRAKFKISGTEMDYGDTVLYLGVDLRRFYRAYADEVKDCNLRVLSAANDSTDIVAQEKAAWIRQTAADRGLSRFPHLAHDSSDACWNLTDAERTALTASKSLIFSSGANMADRNHVRSVQSGETSAGSMLVNPTARVHALGGN